MTTNTKVNFLFPPTGGSEGGTGFIPPVHQNMVPEGAPAILYGQGTPDGDRAPFNQVNKGSLYLCLNNTDDESHVYQKVDEGGDNDDWVKCLAYGEEIAGSSLATNARRLFVTSKEFNIDNGSGSTDDDLLLVASDGLTPVAATVMYTEATDTAGAEGASVQIGNGEGQSDIVAATNLEASKAVASTTSLTIATGAAVAAGEGIWVRHTGIAATEGGKYKVTVEFTVDDAA